MIDAIVEQYEKHGWKLRRILVIAASADDLKSRYPEASLVESDVDALWFSRPNRDAETWELRRLSGSPFALLEVFTSDVIDEDRENRLRNIERRMAESFTKADREIPLEK